MTTNAGPIRESIFAKGKLFELVHETQDDGRVFEVARRAPGVRMIIVDKVSSKILLTKEFRKELDTWDYRLPGGKVFDSLDEYEAFRQTGEDILVAAEQKVVQEAREEAGIGVKDSAFFKKSTLGATVEWDLYVFEITDFDVLDGGQELEQGEQIEADSWFSYDEVRQKILGGEMQEERIALILLQWLENKGEA